MDFKIGDIFYDDALYSERVEFCNNNNLIIIEITPDENGRRFQIAERPVLTDQQRIAAEIYELKYRLAKYKEDVEQVELFDMHRDDYEEKKKLCSDIILKLRELEKTLKNMS